MKDSEASASSEKRIRRFFGLWREHKVRDPAVAGSIGQGRYF